MPVEVCLGAIEGPEPLLVVTLRDVTALQAGREAQFEAEAKYQSLVEQIPAVVYLDPVSEDADSIYVSPQVTNLLGISQDEWLDRPLLVAAPRASRGHRPRVGRVPGGVQRPRPAEPRVPHGARGRHDQVGARAGLPGRSDEQGSPWLIQGVIFDISLRKRAEEQVAFLAYHDKLTGLPNRALFEEMLEGAIARARRHDLGVGVVFLDLDNFKLVNDSLGHQAGDLLLAQLGDRLRGCTRETDLVARQGGDEFLMLLSDLERGTGGMPGGDPAMLVAESVAERVHEALREPFDLNGTEFYASGSLGISLFPQDALDAQTLLKNADAAMYQSKRHDPGGYVVFATGGENSMEKLSLTTRLRRAVDQENWVLHYQPVVNLADGTVDGVEALIRWHDPNGGIVPPGEFIPLAEELGLIEAIGDWVIDEMARQHAAWAADGLDLMVGFNLSPRQLWSAHLAETMLGKLAASRRRPAPRGGRDHGVDRDGRPRPHAEDPGRAARLGPDPRDRRLRDRVLVARAAEAPAGGHPEDRPIVHPRRPPRRRPREHGQGDDPARAGARDDPARRGHRDPGRARLPASSTAARSARASISRKPVPADEIPALVARGGRPDPGASRSPLTPLRRDRAFGSICAMTRRYDASEIEPKWQRVWAEEGLYRASDDPDDARPRFYALDMFPYPSGDLHMGHAEAFSGGDVDRAVPGDAGLQRAPPDRMGRVRPTGRERGDQARARPDGVDLREHRAAGRVVRADGHVVRLVPAAAHVRPRVLPLDPVAVPAVLREGARVPEERRRSTGARRTRPCSRTSR